MYSVKLTRLAAEKLRQIEVKARTQIVNKIEDLKEAPLLPGKPLKGSLSDYRSIRAAEQRYRIIYTVEAARIVVIVVAVGIRKSGDKKDIYELMKKYVRIGLLGEHTSE